MHSCHSIGTAVDLGSTTIAVCVMDLEKESEILSLSFPNPQCIYGADVITRIRHCMENEEKEHIMNRLVRESLWKELEDHLDEDCGCIEKMVISGNTTMLHILTERPVSGMAAAPFKPESLEFETVSHNRPICMGGGSYTEIYPPGISAFVGADILSGVSALDMGKKDSYELLVDLGTNGEMLLLNKKQGYASSTACGPVFDHAVAGASYGSESIKAIANCVKRGLIDGNGTLREPFFDTGIEIDKGFVITQTNVRNFQMAKAAIYAGIRCLMQKAAIKTEDIDRVYISGGLGFYMDIRDAVTVKMLPEDFTGKITVSGNTSLEGAKKLLLASNEAKDAVLSEYEQIRKRTESFNLADFAQFQDIYLESINM